MNTTIIKPPNPIQYNGAKGEIVFLAGSIEMGEADQWQSKVEKYFQNLQSTYTLLNPRRDDWDSSWKQSIQNTSFYTQVTWELEGLEIADKIIMYLDPNTKAPISMLEFGLFARSGKLLMCCPEGFWRKGNIDIVCEKYNVPTYDSIDALLKANFINNS